MTALLLRVLASLALPASLASRVALWEAEFLFPSGIGGIEIVWPFNRFLRN